MNHSVPVRGFWAYVGEFDRQSRAQHQFILAHSWFGERDSLKVRVAAKCIRRDTTPRLASCEVQRVLRSVVISEHCSNFFQVLKFEMPKLAISYDAETESFEELDLGISNVLTFRMSK